ncbi:MAG: hypothetical protein ACOCY8_03015, partial [Spirochaetota bacterium]
AVQDSLYPDRIVIGFAEPDSPCALRARELLEEAHRRLYLISTPFVRTNLEIAELIKYVYRSCASTRTHAR